MSRCPRAAVRSARRASLVVVLCWLAAFAVSGCQHGTPTGLEPRNEPPHVEITSSPVANSTSFYSVPIYWRAWDDDGRVMYSEYAVDTQDTVWTRTSQFSASLVFSATGANQTEWHTFYLRAVDDRGMHSPVVELSFNARTIAPQSRALFPVAVAQGNGYNSLVSGGPALLIRWSGTDADGVTRKTPVGYRFARLRIPNSLIGNPAGAAKLLDDPSTQWQYLPSPTDTMEVSYRDLVSGDQAVQYWVFAWRAVDEAGAVEPAYVAGRNLFFYGAYISRQGPALTVNSVNLGTFEWAGVGRDSAQYVFDHQLNLTWTADAGITGAVIAGYRWGVDVVDIGNKNDPGWATGFTRSLLGINGLVFRDRTAAIHDIVIQVQDSNGAITTGVLRLTLAAFTGEKDILWVDDVNDIRAAGIQPSDDEHRRHSLGALRLAMNTLGRSTAIDSFTTMPVSYDPLYHVAPPLADMCRYKFVVWEVGIPGSSPGVAFTDFVATRIGQARIRPNPLSSYLDAGGSMVIMGYSAVRATMTPIPTNPPTSANLLAPGRYNFAADYMHMCDQISWAKTDANRNGFQGADPTDWAKVHGIPGGGGFPRLQFDKERWYGLPATGRVGAEVAVGRFALRPGDELDPLYTLRQQRRPWPQLVEQGKALCGYLHRAAPRLALMSLGIPGTG